MTRLDGFDYEDALDLIERGVAADSTFPREPIVCLQGADPARSARDPECELVSRHLSSAGFDAEYISPHDDAFSGRDLGSFMTGAAQFRDGIAGHYFSPGAIAGNLTSFGAHPNNFFCSEDQAICPEEENQTSIARWVRAGATGVHGATNEPMNNTFPNAATLLLYTFGYSLGESWFFNQQFLYWQNIYLGDPLTSPYADRPKVELPGPDDVYEGSPVTITATHPFGVRMIEVFVDGERVAATEGDEIRYEHGLSHGEEQELLVVAEAKSKNVTRPGWPVETLKNRSRPKGWATLTLRAESAPFTEEPESAGCGCQSISLPTSWTWTLFLPPLLMARRRATNMLP